MSTGEQEIKTDVAQAPGQPVPMTTDQKVNALQTIVLDLIDRVEKITVGVEEAKKAAEPKAKSMFGGRREAVPIKDLLTGDVYISKAAVGKTFATQVGKDPAKDTMCYYDIEKKLRMPDKTARFVEASSEEGTVARDKHNANVALKVDELNKQLAEQAAKLAAATPVAPVAKDDSVATPPVVAPPVVAPPVAPPLATTPPSGSPTPKKK